MEPLKLFIEKFKTDAAFAEKYSALNSIDAILEQAKMDGYAVTKEDVQAAINELAKNTGELSEAELAVVAGGAGGPGGGKACEWCWCRPSGGAEFRNGALRVRCHSTKCQGYVSAGGSRKEWRICACYGTDKCIDMWHHEIKCPNTL